MEILKLSYAVDKLWNILDERIRLVSVLKMKPSNNDTINLEKQLNSTLDSLQETAKTVTWAGQAQLVLLADRYNEAVASIPDDVVDKELYKFTSPTEIKESDATKAVEAKKVRFKDDLLEYEEDSINKNSSFAPYSDELTEQEQLEQDKSKLFQGGGSEATSHLQVVPQLSNQELFIQQQQQLLEQDSHLDSLSQSVHRSHGLSVDIHHEMTDQNDGVLRDLESLVDSSGRNLDRAKTRLAVFENTARENGPCLIIVVLVIILVVLLIAL